MSLDHTIRSETVIPEEDGARYETRPYVAADPGLIAARKRDKPREYVVAPVIYADDRPLEPRYFIVQRQRVTWNEWVKAWDTFTFDEWVGRKKWASWEAAESAALELCAGGNDVQG